MSTSPRRAVSARQFVQPQFGQRLVIGVILSVALVALLEVMSRSGSRADVEARVKESLNATRVELQSALSQDVQVLRGLAGYVRSKPEVTEAEFRLIAGDLVAGASSSVRNLALARDLVISHVYPLVGNEAALGLDYRATPEQWAAVERVLASDQIIIAGPVTLAQGGVGLIARHTVRRRKPPVDDGSVWGIASIVIDFEDLLERSGLSGMTTDYRLALSGRDGDPGTGDVIWGDQSISTGDPVELDVILPGGAWKILVAPKEGWPLLTRYFPYFLVAGLVFLTIYILVIVVRGRIARERSQARRELLEALRRAEAASAAKSSFMAVISHELRTPLNAIIGFGSLLESQPPDSPVWKRAPEYASDIRRSGEFLLSIINDILDLSRIESRAQDLDLVEFNVFEVVESAVGRMRIQFREADLDLIVEKPKDLVFALADRRAVEQILSNLLSNALKYAGSGAQVVVSVAPPEQGRVCVTVSDTGPGIPADMIDEIMEPFVQLSSSYTRQVGGVGLGLTICQSLAQAMEAGFTIESAPGAGATVRLELLAEQP